MTVLWGRRPHEVWHDENVVWHCERVWESQSEREHRRRLGELVREHVPAGASVLEVGCGTGLVYGQLAGTYAYTGVDISAEMLKVARDRFPGADFRRGDGYDLLFPDASFDAVACFEVLAHLPSAREVLAEMIRVTRDVVLVTVWPCDRGRMEAPDPEARGGLLVRYGDEFLRSEIAAAGPVQVTARSEVDPPTVAYVLRKQEA